MTEREKRIAEIAPCPFCGAPAYWESHAQIECTQCPAKIGMFIEHDDGGRTRAAVLAAWNVRAADSEIARLREALSALVSMKHEHVAGCTCPWCNARAALASTKPEE